MDRAAIEECLVRKEAGEEDCASSYARDCLRASVPFRTDYVVIKRCFRCCVLKWLNESGLGANMDFRVEDLKRSFVEFRGPEKVRGPDLVDFGLENPRENLLVHTHAFAALSHVRMHSHHGCSLTPTATNATKFLFASLYQYDPNYVVFPKFRDTIGKEPADTAKCVKEIRRGSRPLLIDLWRQNKFVPEVKVFKKLSLVLANNVGNMTKPYCSEKRLLCVHNKTAPYDIIRERTIGLRAISVWQAILEHRDFSKRIKRQQRLLLCCCMNVDAKHGDRNPKLAWLQRFPEEFGCAAIPPNPNNVAKNHLGPPPKDLKMVSIEADTERLINEHSNYKLRKNIIDAHMPLLLLNSKFVFSPNGVAEACFREYEALIAGAYPLIDESSWYPRRQFLRNLPVVSVANWSTVTPTFLEDTWQTLESKSFDIQSLFLPFYYDHILTAIGI